MPLITALVACLLLLAAQPVLAEAPRWYVLSHDDGCIPIEKLARHERLPGTPASPEEFVRMMRDSGRPAEIGPAPGIPPDQAGNFVMVRLGESKMPIFVRAEVCDRIGAGHR